MNQRRLEGWESIRAKALAKAEAEDGEGKGKEWRECDWNDELWAGQNWECIHSFIRIWYLLNLSVDVDCYFCFRFRFSKFSQPLCHFQRIQHFSFQQLLDLSFPYFWRNNQFQSNASWLSKMDAIANRIVSAVARGSRFNSTETQNGVKGGEAEQAQRIGMVVDVGNSPLVYGLIPSKLVFFSKIWNRNLYAYC